MLSRRVLLKSTLLLPSLPQLLQEAAWAQERTAPEFAAPDSDWLLPIARQLRQEFNLPAFWVAVNVADKIEAAVVGVRKLGDPTPAQLGDPLMVASVSKPMVGFWIATLVDEGKLTYDTNIFDVLPELKEGALEEHHGITLGQLLTHTAELVRDSVRRASDLSHAQFPEERLRQSREILSKPSPPESIGKRLYSNNGIILAACVAEKVAGEPYETAAGRFYREKLGLSSWGVWDKDLKDDLSFPWPHLTKNNVHTVQSPSSMNHNFPRASGSSHCSITDLVRFGLLSVNATEAAYSLLKPQTWGTILDYGEGSPTTLESYEASDRGASLYDHGGLLFTARTFLRNIPEWRTAFAFHTNCEGGELPERATALIYGAIRQRRAQLNPPSPCRIRLAGLDTVDASWQKVVVPRATDKKIYIRIRYTVESNGPTGDMQTLIKLGDEERRYDHLKGVEPGARSLRFSFDTPKDRATKALVVLDALGTAGNVAPEGARFESVLNLV